MRLIAIINAWADSLDLLPYCIEAIQPLVENVLIIWSEKSNYGEYDDSMRFFSENYRKKNISFANWEPDLSRPPVENERSKRNHGLWLAKKQNFTHFLMMDADEFYQEDEFLWAKDHFTDDLVCHTKVYFAKPTLTIGLDTTIVPFIHKLTTNLAFMWNKSYPYAFVNGQIKIDPTRQLNINSGVVMSPVVMHHFSWLRKNYDRKIRNSTARTNIERSTILQDLVQAKEGYFCQFYGKTLASVPNVFGLPDLNAVQKF